jgi:hypothetical protein
MNWPGGLLWLEALLSFFSAGFRLQNTNGTPASRSRGILQIKVKTESYEKNHIFEMRKYLN